MLGILSLYAADETFLLSHPSTRLARLCLQVGTNKKCLRDKPEKTSSIRLYIFVSQLFTQTLQSVKAGPQSADRLARTETHNSQTTGWRTLSFTCLRVCVRVFAVFRLSSSPVLQPDRSCLCPHMSCLI